MPDRKLFARRLSTALALLISSGCTTIEFTGNSGRETAYRATSAPFTKITLSAGAFDLTAYLRRPASPTDTLSIYIEGDGAAWASPYHPPRDPTPKKPLVLSLANADVAPAVAYLGRPCQYLEPAALARCPDEYWVEKRFAPEVVVAYDIAITNLKALYGARNIRLVGYSGGGTIATLVAARRADVIGLITIAAPLAVSDWTKWHGATPLTGSLDPMEIDTRLPFGVHFAGSDDKTVPASINRRFVHAKGGRLIEIADFDHDCCWLRDWTALQQRALAEERK